MNNSKENSRRYRENMRRKAMGLPSSKKVINDYTVTLPVPIPIAEHRKGNNQWEDKSAAIEGIADLAQKAIRKAWAKTSDKPHIIIVEPGNKITGKEGYMRYKVELDQLNLDRETMDRFKSMCEKIHMETHEFIDYQNQLKLN